MKRSELPITMKKVTELREQKYPVPHKRFRIEGTGGSAGSHIDVAVTPEMRGSCLHVFDEGAEATTTLYFSLDGGRRFPVGLCAVCAKVTTAKQN